MGYSVLLMGEAMPLVLSPAGQIHGRTAREAGPHRPAGIDRTDAPARPLRCAAIGGEWLGEVYGGLNRFFVDLLNHLPAAGVEVAATAAGKKSEADPAGTSFSPAHDFLPRRLWRARREVRRLAAGADLVACHFALYGWPALPLGDKPLVVHFHGPWTGESTAEGAGRVNVFAKRAIERAVYRRADRIITLSGAFKQLLVERYGVAPERVAVVPGAVDLGRLTTPLSRAAARIKLGLPAGRPIVLCVRRLARRMGLEALLEATDLLRRTMPDVLVLIAGKGPLEEELRGRIEELGLENHVRLLGFVPDADLPATFRAADVSVVPSRELEGFGLVTLESLAAGTPVLVTPVGGLVEAVGGLDAGRLVLPGGEPADLFEGLADALDRPASLPDSAACVRHVRENFDWPVIASRVADVYREAVVA